MTVGGGVPAEEGVGGAGRPRLLRLEGGDGGRERGGGGQGSGGPAVFPRGEEEEVGESVCRGG